MASFNPPNQTVLPGVGGAYSGATSGGSGAATTGAGTPATSANSDPAGIQSAYTTLVNLFAQYDLPGLDQWAWNELTSGSSSDQILIDLYNQPQFQQRFPYYQAMLQAGLPAMTPAQMLNNEAQYKSAMSQYGITPTTNPQDYMNLFMNQVSPSEFQSRLQNWNAVQNLYGPQLRQGLENYLGVNHGVQISDSDLYKMLSGLDESVGAKYASVTGTPMTNLTFNDLANAETKAQAAYKAEYNAGGQVQQGQGAAQEQSGLASRQTMLGGLENASRQPSAPSAL